MSVKPIPDGYHSITPYLIVDGGQQALEFYQQAFGAEVEMIMPGPERKIMHAECRVGDSKVMLADEFPEYGALSPKSLGGTAVSLALFVEDVDSVFAKAIQAGGTELRPVQDQFYGDRMGTLEDPFGHKWTVGTHIEDLTPEEIAQRQQEFLQQGG